MVLIIIKYGGNLDSVSAWPLEAGKWNYFLFCLVARARPLCDDILLGFSVRCESESYSGESRSLATCVSFDYVARTALQTYKVDANDQLRFTPSCSFDFDGLRSPPVRCQRRLGHPTMDAVLSVSSSVAWRLHISAHESGMSLRVATGIDGRRMMRKLLLLRRWKWTLRPRRIGIVCVAWRPAKAVGLLIHGKTGGG